MPVALVYVVANLALGVHLYHGAWSLFQSMGWTRPWRRQFATVFAAADRARQRVLPARRHVRSGRLSPLTLESLVPPGSIQRAWDNHRFTVRLVNASNKRRFKIIVVGTGLAGASAAATLAELGYEVVVFTFHDSPRRAHSIAAQGGINAAKDYRNDGDSIFRLFYDTIKGGDFRSREANVYRLAQVSNEIIDQATAQGVPFAREYGGLLDNRSFGGAQVVADVLRARADRPAAAARRLPGDDAPGRGGQDPAAHAHGDARRRRARGQRARDHRARPVDRRGRVALRPRRRARHRRLLERVLLSRPTRRRPTRPRSGARTSAARRSRTRASRRSTRPASRSPTTRSPSSR